MKNKTTKTKGENEAEILSLSEAAKIAGYTPEYLNLLARKGKLKAQKIGRNWFTKKEYLDELRIVLYREKNGIKFPSELQGEDRLQENEMVFLDKKRNKFGRTLSTLLFLMAIFPIVFATTYFIQNHKNYTAYENYYFNQPDLKVLNETTRVPRVAGEQTSADGRKVALASENYKISDINVGGSVMIINSEENTALEISNIKSESFIANKKDEVKLMISWQTNKLAISELTYSKNGGQNSQTLREDSYGYSHSVVISGLTPRTSYVYQIKSTDHWSNSTTSDYFGVYTSSKPVSVFDLISNATGEVFGWALTH